MENLNLDGVEVALSVVIQHLVNTEKESPAFSALVAVKIELETILCPDLIVDNHRTYLQAGGTRP